MKKFIKISLISILVILFLSISAIIVIPIVFKDRILELVKTEINNNIEAKVDFSDFNLSLFKTFPDLGIMIDDLKIEGVNEFENIALADIKAITVSVDLLSAFKGEQYEIKSILLESPKMYIMYIEDGKANYDIYVSDEDVSEIIDEEIDDVDEAAFVMSLKYFEAKNASFVYHDLAYDIFMQLKNTDVSMNGTFSENINSVTSLVNVEAFDFVMEGMQYMKNGKISGNADMDIDLDTWKFDFKENNFMLNNMPISLDGYFTMNDDDTYDFDMSLITDKLSFKDLLSLVPAIYKSDMQGLETSGKVAMSAFLKGKMTDELIPAFDFSLLVENAMFKYPDLPKSVDKININANINNKTGQLDNTVVDISKFNMNIGNNPLEMQMNLKNPISDPAFLVSLNARVDLSQINDVIPLEDTESLNGIIESDIFVNGKMSYIDNELYDKIDANGSLKISQMVYASNEMPLQTKINTMELLFAPQYVDLKDFSSLIGNSDISASGRIDNLYSYVFNDETLVAAFTLKSNKLDVNEFMSLDETNPESENETANDTNSTVSSDEMQIPANISFVLNTDIQTIIYEDIEINNVSGNVIIENSVADLSNLSMNIFNGSIKTNGKFDTQDKYSPKAEFNFNMQDIDFRELYAFFPEFDSLAPILADSYGLFSANLGLNLGLNSDLSPIYESVNASGYLQSKNLSIKDNNTLNKFAEILKNQKFKDPEIKNLKINFIVKDGKIEVEPFDIKFGNNNAKIFGYNTLDLDINYQVDLSVPRSELGGEANKLAEQGIKELQKLGIEKDLSENVEFTAFITGSVMDPKLSLNLKDLAKNTLDDLKDQVKDQIEDKIDEVKEQVEEKIDEAKEEAIAKAKQEADKLIKDAEKKRDQLVSAAEKQATEIRKAGKESAAKIRKEAKEQGDKLIKEAKNPLQKKAAEKTAETLNKEADKKAKDVENEANRNADALVAKAKKEGDDIVNAAKKKADKLISDAEKM